MVRVEAIIPYGQGELVNLIHRLGVVELEVSECLVSFGNSKHLYNAILSISAWFTMKESIFDCVENNTELP